jgi:membrane-associated phospholipid phosphatase
MEAIRFLQSFHTDFLDRFFVLVTTLGEDTFAMVVVGIILWCLDKRFGYRIGFAFLSSGLVNSSLKNLLRVPRPFTVDPGLRVLRPETATGYSFPSGHTQFAATFWTSFALRVRKAWFSAVAGLCVVLVALSRMYLGVHTLQDVLAGALLGIGWVFAANALFEYEERTGRRWIFLVVAVPALAALPFFPDSDYWKTVGAFVGFLAGYLVESRYIRYEVEGALWKQVVKVVVGMGVVFAIRLVGKAVLPEGLFSDFFRYLLMTVWVTAAAPLVFQRMFRPRAPQYRP